MGRVTQCRHEGCEQPPLDGALFCGRHISAKHRCKATKAGSNGKTRCKKAAMYGLEVCATHGGHLPGPLARSQRAEVLTAMQKFTRPYEGDLNPFTAFEMEIRRTIGRISWYDEQLGALKSENDLIWGKVKHETAGGKDGVPNTTYEARLHILEEAQRWERKHLLELEKVWLAAGFERERLDLFKNQASRLLQVTLRAVKALGINTDDPSVREVLASVFLEGERPEYLAIERRPDDHG